MIECVELVMMGLYIPPLANITILHILVSTVLYINKRLATGVRDISFLPWGISDHKLILLQLQCGLYPITGPSMTSLSLNWLFKAIGSLILILPLWRWLGMLLKLGPRPIGYCRSPDNQITGTGSGWGLSSAVGVSVCSNWGCYGA